MSKFFRTWTVSTTSTPLVKDGGTLSISQASPSSPIVFKAQNMGQSDQSQRQNDEVWDKVTNAELINQSGMDLIQGTVLGKAGWNPFSMSIGSDGKLCCIITKSRRGQSVGAASSGDDDDGSWIGDP